MIDRSIDLNLSIDRRPVEPSQRKEAIARTEDDLEDVLVHLLELVNAYDIDLAEAFGEAVTNIKKRFGMQ